MPDEKWLVTHASEHGAVRMWWVDGETAARMIESEAKRGPSNPSEPQSIGFPTLTGAALIWLTPGQSLTVEKSNW